MSQSVNLPTGTVTFLFTDTEGSTRLWERDPLVMQAALERHDALIELGVSKNQGSVIKARGEGDSHFCVFSRASDAVAAARDIQRALQAEHWPTSAPLRVRMGIHTGEALLRDGGYYGSEVNRCARLRSLGHGGQVLISGTTHKLLGRRLPDDVTLRDLGEHRLKDLQGTERIYQLEVAGLAVNFPQLRSPAATPYNLPVQRTALLGRERDMAALRELILRAETSVVTLTGPAGTGKTRLGTQVAADLSNEFSDGSFFVSLSPISDAAQVIPTIAQTIGVREGFGTSPLTTLIDYLKDRRILLILDNFEQILPAAAAVAALTAGCLQLKVLVTSRAALRIYGEREYALAPLGRPDLDRVADMKALLECASVALFEQRAQEVKADFELTAENAAAVAGICVRLDGLPLAIELAAARSKVLSPASLLERLAGKPDRRAETLGRPASLQLLTGGARDLPARQQTLRSAIAWSYDLLDEREREVFRALSVFVGGFSLQGVEAVAGHDVLDIVTSLVDKNLVHRIPEHSHDTRFTLLETIREFGLEQLHALNALEIVRYRHAQWCVNLAETVDEERLSNNNLRWADTLKADYDNLRAALVWSLSDPKLPDMPRATSDPFPSESPPRLGIRLACALWWNWYLRGDLAEGRKWLEQAMIASGANNISADDDGSNQELLRLRARAVVAAGHLAEQQGDIEASTLLMEKGLALSRDLGEQRLAGYALRTLGGLAGQSGHFDRARAYLEESRQLCRDIGDSFGTRLTVIRLGHVAYAEGKLERAKALYEERRELSGAVGDKPGMATALGFLGAISADQGDYVQALKLSKQSLEMKSASLIAIATVLGTLARIAHHNGNFDRAARLLGSLDRFRLSIGTSTALYPFSRFFDENVSRAARNSLGNAPFETAFQEGRAMSRERLIEYALEG